MKNPDRSWLLKWDNKYGVYVGNCIVDGVAWLYVGLSAKPAPLRWKDHLMGYASSRFVKRYGTTLARKYMKGPDFKRVDTRDEGEALEAKVALKLKKKGFRVRSA